VTQTKIPTWVTLRQVPKEFQSVSHQIAVGIGEVLGADEANGSLEDPKFCLALDSGAGWEPTVLVTNSISQTKATIICPLGADIALAQIIALKIVQSKA
jgi:hypothetical protein